MPHRTSSSVLCQIFLAALLAAAAAAPARADGVGGSLALPEPSGRDFLLERLGRTRLFGSMSVNWRNVGPRKPGFETQIQNEVYLADMYFGVEGPALEGVPFHLELNVPTASQGDLRLFQLYTEYDKVRRIRLQFGKFLVPFGRYNELYRPDQFLTVTRPLLYASPDSIDLVVRPNSPRPPVSAGYTDIGARFSWYPVRVHPLIPDELTLYVVNGLGESTNRSRTFPNPQNLGIPGPPTSGVTPDFGHQNNNMADNNNAKSVGARVIFALGDLRLPFPIPERDADLDGVILGFSGMGGNYDLEGELAYQMWDMNWSFQYRGVSFSGEAMYTSDQFLNPLVVSTSTASNPALVAPIQQVRRSEEIYGYFVQAAFPIIRKPAFGRRLTGVLVYNQLYRRGPLLDFLLNYNDGSTVFPSLTGVRADTTYVQRQIDKYTAAVNYQLTDHFALKFDYSYWAMGKSTVVTEQSLGTHDIYQGAFSLVMGF
ncbi:MAG: hypothetical protein KGL74_01195 [Elusimicrobia bacterium]|nr:hypothetical protein [Elusimicrobiota bacterium]